VELVLLVKQLLYTEKYTLEGARQKLDAHRKGGDLRAIAPHALARETARAVERDLHAILDVLEGRRAPGTARPRRWRRTRPALDCRAAEPRSLDDRMRLLCTNDDGILAAGLDTLVRAASRHGEVTWWRPDREQSATSHSLTLHHPVRPVQRGERGGRWTARPPTASCSPSRR
jgi:hypothetical protein